jgi:hypothetical protein
VTHLPHLPACSLSLICLATSLFVPGPNHPSFSGSHLPYPFHLLTKPQLSILSATSALPFPFAYQDPTVVSSFSTICPQCSVACHLITKSQLSYLLSFSSVFFIPLPNLALFYRICLICSICLQVPTALPFVSLKFSTYLSSIHVLT